MKSRNVFAVLCIVFLVPTAIIYGDVFDWCGPTTNMDGSPLTDLAGFKIYCGFATGKYSIIKDAAMAQSVPTSSFCGQYGTNYPEYQYAASNVLATTGKYYCVATAYDAYGNESGYSNEITFNWPSAGPLAPTNLRVSEILRFEWADRTQKKPSSTPPAGQKQPSADTQSAPPQEKEEKDQSPAPQLPMPGASGAGFECAIEDEGRNPTDNPQLESIRGSGEDNFNIGSCRFQRATAKMKSGDNSI